jgi:hypothetical protein
MAATYTPSKLVPSFNPGVGCTLTPAEFARARAKAVRIAGPGAATTGDGIWSFVAPDGATETWRRFLTDDGPEIRLTHLEPEVLEHVLVEYEGPRLATLLRGGQRWLTLETFGRTEEFGEGDTPLSWLEVPLVDRAWMSLLAGKLDVRTALQKEQLFACARDWSGYRDVNVRHLGRILNRLQVEFVSLPERALPSQGALLPSDSRAGTLKKITDPDLLAILADLNSTGAVP